MTQRRFPPRHVVHDGKASRHEQTAEDSGIEHTDATGIEHTDAMFQLLPSSYGGGKR
jgi:hypothetical protein